MPTFIAMPGPFTNSFHAEEFVKIIRETQFVEPQQLVKVEFDDGSHVTLSTNPIDLWISTFMGDTSDIAKRFDDVRDSHRVEARHLIVTMIDLSTLDFDLSAI
jgi:hypothetical protein